MNIKPTYKIQYEVENYWNRQQYQILLKMKHFLVKAATILLILFYSTRIKSDDHRKILMIHSYHQGLDWTDETSRGAQSIFKTYEGLIELHFDYLDSKRKDIAINHQSLNTKHKNSQYDVIIISDNDALEYMNLYHKTIYKNTPLVFCGINGFTKNLTQKLINTTGIAEIYDIVEDIKAIKQIHPNLKKINFLLDNTTTGKVIKELIRKDSLEIESMTSFDILNDITFFELKESVSKTRDNEIFYLLPFNRDKNGEFLSFKNLSKLLQKYSKSPVYTPISSFLGHGVVGGKIVSGFDQGRMAAQMAIQILNKTETSEIPLILESTGKFTYDYNLLTKFKIDKSNLPQNSTIINTPEAFYIKYRYTTIATLSTISGSLFISLLIIYFQRKKNKRSKIKKDHLRKGILLASSRKHNILLKKNIIDDNNYTATAYFKNNKIYKINREATKTFGIKESKLHIHKIYFSDLLNKCLKRRGKTLKVQIENRENSSLKTYTVKTIQINKHNQKDGYIMFFKES